MPGSDDASIDELAIAYGWMQRLGNDRAITEEWTIATLRRYRRHECPGWLQRREMLLRLQYLTTRVVLERRGTIDPPKTF
jgi:hypothetical protein